MQQPALQLQVAEKLINDVFLDGDGAQEPLPELRKINNPRWRR